MAKSIPASALVSVVPSVLSAGGSPLSLASVFITRDGSVPLGSVMSFSSLTDVGSWFGTGSTEYNMAAVYFNGYDNSFIKPDTLYFVQANSGSVAAYLRGARLGLTLAQLTALTAGTITLTVDGTPRTSTSINLSGAASFSAAAALIQTAIGSSVTCTYDSQRDAFLITSATTGVSSTITAVTAETNGIGTALKLTAAAGASLQGTGAVASTPAGVMAGVIAVTQDFVSFMTVYQATSGDLLAYASWANSQNQRFVYVAADNDATAVNSGNTTSFGPVTSGYNGVCPVWGTVDKAAFICGAIASIDFTRTNGRIAFAYKSQAGLTADVTDQTTAANLIANGYNFYANYATASQQFTFLQPGQVSGKWDWLDPYVNEIYFNAQMQQALVNFLANATSVPYNSQGYGGIRAALMDPINQAVNAGIIRAGVALSSAQIVQVNTQAGVSIDATLAQQGWYLQITPATAQIRATRSSPPMTLWYTDGGSIRTLNLASIDVL